MPLLDEVWYIAYWATRRMYMRILKKIWGRPLLYSMLLAVVLSLAACASTERQETDNTNTKEDLLEEWKDKLPKDMPEYLELKLKDGGIEIDGFLEVSKELSDWKVEELILKRHLFDETECLDDLLELLGNPKVLERRKMTRDETLEDGTPLKADHADLENNSMAQARNAYFLASFEERGIVSVEDKFMMNPFGLYDGAEKNKELAFGSYESVCSEIEKFLKRQKIENILKPTVYSFSPELLQKVADQWYQESVAVGDEDNAERYKITLGEEDGVYLIRYMQGYRGVPYSYMSLVGNDVDGNRNSIGTSMCVEYGKQGIKDVSGTEFFDVKQVEKEQGILSLYDILNKVCEYFDKNKDNKMVIKEIGLCYLPVIKEPAKLEFTGVPVWYLVYGEGEAAQTGTAREVITFDARTGEIYG